MKSRSVDLRLAARVRPAWRRHVAATLAALLLLGLGPAVGQVALSPNAPTTYVVQPGDSLWDIAGRFLREPWRWQEVWDANPGVSNPDLIYPGDVLELTYSDGRPRIRAARGGGLRTVKLSPRVRTAELDRAIPTIPVNVVAPFLAYPVVASAEELNDLPYVVGFPEERIVATAGDVIFVRGGELPLDDGVYEIVRPGQPYKDPDSNRVLGYEAAFVASARLDRPGDPATMRVTRSEKEIEIGDRVRYARQDEPIRNFYPQPAPPRVRGEIIAVLNGVSQIGQYDVVVLNRGARHGLEIGHVFEVFRGGDVRRDHVRSRRAEWNWRNASPFDTANWFGDYELDGWVRDKPDENAPLPLHRRAVKVNNEYIAPDSGNGLVMVFRVADQVSFGLVMYATDAMHVGETVAAPRSL